MVRRATPDAAARSSTVVSSKPPSANRRSAASSNRLRVSCLRCGQPTAGATSLVSMVAPVAEDGTRCHDMKAYFDIQRPHRLQGDSTWQRWQRWQRSHPSTRPALPPTTPGTPGTPGTPRKAWSQRFSSSRRSQSTACAASTDRVPMPFDARQAYEKHPQVAIRPEEFGGLAYHYGNRRLVFLKTITLAELVMALADFPSAADALAAHAPATSPETYAKALSG